MLEQLNNQTWSRFAGGCHLDRDSGSANRSAGLESTWLDSLRFSGVTQVTGEVRFPGAAS
ncbi:Methylase involved in ubiquinone/menaquinone biosynthesis [Nocardioides sp. PD653]|nr:Methylase involved in ubiquinone/menaquinone biosynthesis [Nocardioides sp. PD653-B2]GAW56509.1 Methylase involved in ubiquinone/menaquinone biosynthesis [Nocardioides sp. PD653]